MNDTTFYQRINLLDDDALEEMPAASPRAPRVRPRLGKAKGIALVALLYTTGAALIMIGMALSGKTFDGGGLLMTMPLGHGLLLHFLGCALVTALAFALAALKGRLTE